MYKIQHHNNVVNVSFFRGYSYAAEQIAIKAELESGEPWAVYSKCIPDADLGHDETILDTNNMPEIVSILEKESLVKDTGRKVRSGYCEFSIVKVLVHVAA
ncbi:MAG: DUF4313 domain-containing protein [Alteromonadaceae bacterium]|nr:DUF4313 domain-containing protein [Alteromonadaceae bacterium]